MKLDIVDSNDRRKSYIIPDEAIGNTLKHLVDNIVLKYSSLEFNRKLGIKTGVRTFLIPFLQKYLGDDVLPGSSDPVVHILQLFEKVSTEIYGSASIEIKTSSDNRATTIVLSISGEGESGGQLAFTWTQGQR